MPTIHTATRGRVLIARVETTAGILTAYFAMDKRRTLTGYLERILVATGIRGRGPLVYLGGGWHPHPDPDSDTGAPSDTDAETDTGGPLDSLSDTGFTDSASGVGPGTTNSDTSRETDSLTDLATVDDLSDAIRDTDPDPVTTTFLSQPPGTLVEFLEDSYQFSYAGVDLDIVPGAGHTATDYTPTRPGAHRHTLSTTRSLTEFDTLPQRLDPRSDVDWTPPVADHFDVDWDLTVPPEPFDLAINAGVIDEYRFQEPPETASPDGDDESDSDTPDATPSTVPDSETADDEASAPDAPETST